MADQHSEDTKAEKGKVSTLAPEDIMIITELAEVGLKSLKDMLPSIRKVVSGGDSAITADNLAHLESLVREGPDTVTHFSNMCQYLVESAGMTKGCFKAVGSVIDKK